jgi:hypothetical protein
VGGGPDRRSANGGCTAAQPVDSTGIGVGLQIGATRAAAEFDHARLATMLEFITRSQVLARANRGARAGRFNSAELRQIARIIADHRPFLLVVWAKELSKRANS